MPKKRKSPSSGAARRTVASKTSSAPDDDAEQPVLRADPQTAAAPTKRQRLTSAGRDAHTGVHSRAPGGGNGSGYAGEQLRAGEEVVVEFWVGSGRHHLQPELFTGKVSRSLPQNTYQVAFDDGDVRTVHARMIRRLSAGGTEPQTSYVSQPTPRSLETCAICLSAFKDLPLDAPTIRLSRCRHSFCEECINSWWSSSSSNSCPACRVVYAGSRHCERSTAHAMCNAQPKEEEEEPPQRKAGETSIHADQGNERRQPVEVRQAGRQGPAAQGALKHEDYEAKRRFFRSWLKQRLSSCQEECRSRGIWPGGDKKDLCDRIMRHEYAEKLSPKEIAHLSEQELECERAQSFVVEKVLRHRCKNGKDEFLVRWKPHRDTRAKDSWEPRSSFTDDSSLISQWTDRNRFAASWEQKRLSVCQEECRSRGIWPSGDKRELCDRILRHEYGEQLSQKELASEQELECEREQLFFVEKVLKHRCRHGTDEFLVRWQPYRGKRSKDSWEPRMSFPDGSALISRWPEQSVKASGKTSKTNKSLR